ncbi:DNA-directed RNA polymerase subunit omega [Thiovibrio sp. JS02]
MARITVEDCLSQIGNENRFSLIHLAVKRIKQHRKGAPFLVRCKNKEIVCTLREIASGLVNFKTIQSYNAYAEEVKEPVAQEANTLTDQAS